MKDEKYQTLHMSHDKKGAIYNEKIMLLKLNLHWISVKSRLSCQRRLASLAIQGLVLSTKILRLDKF
jgi:hypothetical protein